MVNFIKRFFGANCSESIPSQSPSHISKSNFRFLAIDVETANNNAHSICQIGIAMVSDDGTIQTDSLWIDPKEPFAQFNMKLHGISKKTVAGAPSFKKAIQALRPILERHTLIQHSNFDKRAFDAACEIASVAPINATWLDSVKIARSAWPELKGNGGHGLANLKNHLDLEFKHHDAGEDARAAAQVTLLAEQETGLDFKELAKTQKNIRNSFPIPISIEGNK